jgi:hypothetical protein
VNFNAFYSKNRFKYIDSDLLSLENITYSGNEIIKKTASFHGPDFNFYIDTSDGVNDDLNIYEYCGRIKRVILECNGKPFIFFKSAYSSQWSKNIERLAEENNGKVVPFFKWSFNDKFYSQVFGSREKILKKYSDVKKEYDVGLFCGLNSYDYPKASTSDPLISWSDHKNFSLPGVSENTGDYWNHSRKNLYEKLLNSNFKLIHREKLSYEEYLRESFKCKVIINPPGIGEYTSRMVDQSYLGNCIVLRKNTYNNGLSWKNHIQEVDFNDKNWQNDLRKVVDNFEENGRMCQQYFDNFWTSKAIVTYLSENIK